MTFPLRELVVTPGWTVRHHQFHAIDPTPNLVGDDEALWFKEDMYQARHERFDRLIDLGWCPEGNYESGQYHLVMYAGDFNGRLLRELTTTSGNSSSTR